MAGKGVGDAALPICKKHGRNREHEGSCLMLTGFTGQALLIHALLIGVSREPGKFLYKNYKRIIFPYTCSLRAAGKFRV